MFSINHASQADINRLIELQILAFAEDKKRCGSGPPGYDSVEHQLQALENHTYCKINQLNDIIGGFYYSKSENTIHLIRLFIAPQFHRQGAGQAAVKYLTAKLKSNGIVELETPTFSTNAQHFYEKNGFVKIKRIEYRDGCSYLYKKYY